MTQLKQQKSKKDVITLGARWQYGDVLQR